MTTHRFIFGTACLAAGVLAGCGPMDRPMPPRPSADEQKQIDAAWDAALAPVDKYDRQQWLDALVGTQAYQAGVDTLTFRSEKAFARGKVVMEVFYDRAKPAADRLVVTVFDTAGKQVRQETYTRADVERTAKELFDQCRNTPPQPTDPPELVKKRADVEVRWKAIEGMMPRPGAEK